MKYILAIVLGFSLVVQVAAQDSVKTTVLQDVAVTGQFEPQSIRKSVYQVRTINYDRIALRSPVNIQSVLSTELGIRFTNDLTLGTADISLMGMSGQNVKILLDGVPLLDRGATRESLNQIDVNTIERIEIVEGPMSVIYGTDALAGVINIITRKADNDSVDINARIQEETVGKEYNAFQKKGIHNEHVDAQWQHKGWNIGGGITRNNSGGWQEGRYITGSEPTEWHPKDQWLGTTTVGYKRERINVWYRLNYLDEVITTLGNANPNTSMATDKDYKTSRFTHQAQADWHINDKWFFNGVASYQDYTRKTLTTTYNVATGDRRLSTEAGSQDESVFKTTLFRGMFVYKLSDAVSFQPGVNINLDEGSGDRIDTKRTINDYAFFISSEFKPASFVNIRPGFRFIYNSVYDAPPVVPSINTKFTLSEKFDLRVAYAYGFRSPALRELYFYFFDASHSIKGNPNLKAEYSNSFTSSLVWQAYTTESLKIRSTLGGFYNRFENLIDLGVDPTDPQISTYVNIYRYRTAGGTLENNITWRKLSATVGMSYIGSYNSFSEDDQSLPSFLWTPEVNTTLSYSFTKLGASVSFYYKFTGRRLIYETAEVDNETVTHLARRSSFNMADLTASKKITHNLDVIAGVRNILDITSIQNSSLDTSGAHSTGGPVPVSYGRSYFLSMNFHLTK
ncbi:MAG TPA: TonB-dependent receptor [Ohtaekwangia sp.]|uniref:TonB-dependent receptor plug domain-containing protein n=1 Tax=Ohtaekwangia sp. TaxID=2066019 RepID=UPI002F94384C